MLVNSNSPTPKTPPNVFAKIMLGLVKMGATKYLQNMGTDHIVKPRPSTYTLRKMPHFSKNIFLEETSPKLLLLKSKDPVIKNGRKQKELPHIPSADNL
jgi:hypothetical protein